MKLVKWSKIVMVNVFKYLSEISMCIYYSNMYWLKTIPNDSKKEISLAKAFYVP